MDKALRSGFTTGSCAAAATKAAAQYLDSRKVATVVHIQTPQGKELILPIAGIRDEGPDRATAWVIKDAGDDPDITNGVNVYATVWRKAVEGVVITGGEGIGRITKPGLSVGVGEAAINPGPRQMILKAVQDVFREPIGIEVTIAIPEGVRLAARTLNPTLGIEGGISVIGTTGIVEPMSEEAFKASLVPKLQVAHAQGFRTVALVPGKIGERIAVEQMGLPRDAVAQCSNFIGHMLESAVKIGIRQILLIGHPGKVVKVAAGVFHTHNRVADARMETIVAHAALNGDLTVGQLNELWGCVTTEGAVELLCGWGQEKLFRRIAARASERAQRYVFQELTIGTIMVTLRGDLLGMDETAALIGRETGWLR